jgi:hypothetical protein
VLAKGIDGPIRLIRRGVDEQPCLLDEFDQTTLETQPLALKRIGRLALCADLAGQTKKRGFGHALLYSSRPIVVGSTA